MAAEDDGNHCYQGRRPVAGRRLQSIIDAKILRELLQVILPFLLQLSVQGMTSVDVYYEILIFLYIFHSHKTAIVGG